jgi:NAD(P)-dependent dehydrogenase (short-subunit alcohol dehydrogenase family)
MAQSGSYPNLTGKVAIVTGGSTGIGRAVSLLFARHGAKVVIGDVNPEGRETVETIEREGGTALFVETDAREARQIDNLVATAAKTYGGLHRRWRKGPFLAKRTPNNKANEVT